MISEALEYWVPAFAGMTERPASFLNGLSAEKP